MPPDVLCLKIAYLSPPEPRPPSPPLKLGRLPNGLVAEDVSAGLDGDALVEGEPLLAVAPACWMMNVAPSPISGVFG